MKKILLIALLIGAAGCSSEPKQPSDIEIKNSITYKLLALDLKTNDLATSDPKINELNNKIIQLSHLTGLSAEQVANMSWVTEKEIREKNIDVNIWNILDVISIGTNEKIFVLKDANTEKQLSSFLALYAITRMNTKQDHSTALRSLVEISKVAHNPEKMAQLKKLKIPN